jgi:suppressor for copper-sensitivity B
MRFRSLCVAGILLVVAGLPARAQFQSAEKATITVQTDRTAYVPGESFRLLARFEIADGWHVNANPASYDYLIPTRVEAELPTGWPPAETTYPPGRSKTFAFADTPLSVYEGTIVVQIRSAVPAGTLDGTISIPVTATYQACDQQRCLPPITKALTAALRVGPGGRPNPAVAGMTEGSRPPTGGAPASPATTDLPLILLLGLIGGLILNVMPCVLPVLSIKVLGLVKGAGQSRGQVTAGALMTSFGILVSFWALATAAIAARAAGGAVGWGVQFQQPIFVSGLAVIVTLFCLNLWGLFEIPLPTWMARAADRQTGSGLAGHFGSGLFATLMATPCSAPFLGTAVGFALSQQATTILAVFTAIGLGMALPYLLLAVAPGMARLLPKPGRWMVTLKIIMGFLLAATVVWLLYVLNNQIPATPLALVELCLLGVALCVWLHQRLDGGTGRWLTVIGMLAAALGAMAIASNAGPAPRDDAAPTASVARLIDWQPFDRAGAEQLAADGHLVFVDVTADWCFTCKVNEGLVLETPEIAALFKRHGVIAMRADWTNRSDAIGRFLADHGRYGIPFYMLYRPGEEPIVFSELITKQALIDARESN